MRFPWRSATACFLWVWLLGSYDFCHEGQKVHTVPQGLLSSLVIDLRTYVVMLLAAGSCNSPCWKSQALGAVISPLERFTEKAGIQRLIQTRGGEAGSAADEERDARSLERCCEAQRGTRCGKLQTPACYYGRIEGCAAPEAELRAARHLACLSVEAPKPPQPIYIHLFPKVPLAANLSPCPVRSIFCVSQYKDLGPTVYKYDLFWAIWSSTACRLQHCYVHMAAHQKHWAHTISYHTASLRYRTLWL